MESMSGYALPHGLAGEEQRLALMATLPDPFEFACIEGILTTHYPLDTIAVSHAPLLLRAVSSLLNLHHAFHCFIASIALSSRLIPIQDTVPCRL
jgi:hypothetical protein